jgi:hypothetical protein
MLNLLPLWWWYPGTVYLILLLIVWASWFSHIADLQPQERELAKAAHGAGVIVCGAYLLYITRLPQKYQHWAWGIYAGLCVIGFFWFSIGSTRAQIYRDSRLMGRAVLKIIVGAGIWWLWQQYRVDVWWTWRPYIIPVVTAICLWCWVTGAVQLLICSRQRGRLQPLGGRRVYGDADFDDLGGGSPP